MVSLFFIHYTVRSTLAPLLYAEAENIFVYMQFKPVSNITDHRLVYVCLTLFLNILLTRDSTSLFTLSALYVHSRKYIFPPVSESAQYIKSQQWRSPLWIAAVCLISGSIHFLIPNVLKVISDLFSCRLMTPDQSRIQYDCGCLFLQEIWLCT